MLGYKAASSSLKLALGLQLFSFWIQIIAYATPYWATKDVDYAGLWKACNKLKTEWTCYERFNVWVASWLHVVQIFMTLTITLHFVTLLCILCYLFQKPLNNSRIYELQASLLHNTGNPNADSSTSTNPSFFRNYRENFGSKSSPLLDA
ncbi:DgyrCDS12013 [Dimorphilus gyrociliatus]|uniref:DgyrCDS12013 n=1 Tax=Dimorphilus gyrociliatus TaxID=2664684 RepID=A0A7I8W7K0_9ANNE|nr:DgyrCDS12013 [Dimorphilus gyrociliatus]